MIRKLTEADRELCLDFVGAKPAENLFIIGDIEAFGFDQDFQEIWGDFGEDGRLRAVLLRYEKNAIPYAEGDYDVEAFVRLIDKWGVDTVSGLEAVTEPLLRRINTAQTPRRLFYAQCASDGGLDPTLDVSCVRRAGTGEVAKLIDLYNHIPEFSGSARRPESMKRSMEKGIARSYYIADGERIVSSASTTAETASAAMVVAVCTHPAYKSKGYATRCLTKLTRDLLQEGKIPCLFYDNPEAGKIYRRLGYENIGIWTMTDVRVRQEKV
ncbi:GNAT family N-acetyltransferase [Caenibacillus caldisaponilyticus]|uniref:GNAT family N-acetyltransferase n=1 Tax=Caenibacillus caldisaponilyticus TaxID=1674942 RepID=UPI00098838DB|nr:GNAT family N-acetyltransferase [Caenibacillus caldisaponilyticus]